MIPKIIHYCWFGDNDKSDKIRFCMNTWKEKLPDYEFKEWSEKELDLFKDNAYVMEAYKSKKWAFVSDVFRLYALDTYGGIYLDTDVEVKKSFDDLLELDFFIGSERSKKNYNLGTAVIGAVKNNQIIKDMLQAYSERHFLDDNGECIMTPNPVILGEILTSYGINNKAYSNVNIFEFNNNSILFPYTFFCRETPSSYAVHHFEASWFDAYVLKKQFKIRFSKNNNFTIFWYRQKNKRETFSYPCSYDKILFDFNIRRYKFLVIKSEIK